MEGVHSCCIWAGVTARASLSLGASLSTATLPTSRGATHALNTEGTLQPLISSFCLLPQHTSLNAACIWENRDGHSLQCPEGETKAEEG